MSTTDVKRRRLFIPVSRATPEERLLLVTPWFLREEGERAFAHAKGEEAHASPRIISFTTDDFIEAFFAGVDGYDARTVGSTFESPIRFRDWSEPPREMLDLHGVPRYPESIARHEPTLDLEPQIGSDETDTDGIPTDTPAWLRKLYLPLQRHHQIVTTEVICRHWDAPRVRAARILGAGMVLRRLIPETQPEDAKQQTPERWQDWLAAPAGDGVWREIVDAEMRPRDGGSPIDPEALATDLLGTDDERVALAKRLGHTIPLDEKDDPDLEAVDTLLPTSLVSSLLSPIPAAQGDAADHSAFFGYLPLASSDLILPETAPTALDDIRNRLAARARRQLALEWFEVTLEGAQADSPFALSGEATTHFENEYDAAVAPLRTLVDRLLRPALPVTVAAARSRFEEHNTGFFEIPSRPPDWDIGLDHALDLALDAALDDWWDHAGTQTSTDDADTWWTGGTVSPRDEAFAALKALAAGDIVESTDAAHAGETMGQWLKDAVTTVEADDPAALEALLTERMRLALELFRGGAGTAAFGNNPSKVVVLLLRRVRAFRRQLIQDIHEKVYPDPADRPDVDRERTVDKTDGTGAQLHYLIPTLTVSSLTDEIDAWLEAEKQRADWPRPWDIIDADDTLKRVHEAAAELERLYLDLYERSAGAGSAFAELVAERAEALDTMHPNSQRLCQKGIDVHEQPLLGLLVFPELAPTAVAAMDFLDKVVGRYHGADAERTKAESHALERTPRPRLDSHALYAVWCWVRVQAATDCEQDHLVWTQRSEPFSLADPTDLLGARPVAFELPDLKKMVRDIPRIAKAGANPFAAVTTPPDSGVSTGEEMVDTARTWGIGWICSFGIPVFTICAWILFSIILSILLMIPGFGWLLLLKFCIPVPTRE